MHEEEVRNPREGSSRRQTFCQKAKEILQLVPVVCSKELVASFTHENVFVRGFTGNTTMHAPHCSLGSTQQCPAAGSHTSTQPHIGRS